jgi:hypothetical protein
MSVAVAIHSPYWYPGFSLSEAMGPQNRFSHDHWSYYNPWGVRQWMPRRMRTPMHLMKPSTLRQHVEYENRWKPSSPHTSDNSSDHTVGYSDSERSDGEMSRRDLYLERQLVQKIVEYFGDCKGSLPSERVQNVIKKDYADLYEAVVVARFRKKWHKFLQHCSHTFHLFTRPAQPAPNQDYCWRIRLANNPDWEEADQQDEEYRARRDKELMDKVQSILAASPDQQCLMIDVINELNKDIKGDDLDDAEDVADAGRRGRKIRAGDLKRLMRKCNSNFTIVDLQEGDGQKRATYLQLVEPRSSW